MGGFWGIAGGGLVVRVLEVGGENDDIERVVQVVSTAHTAADVGVLEPNMDAVPMEVEEEIEEPEEIERPPEPSCSRGFSRGPMGSTGV